MTEETRPVLSAAQWAAVRSGADDITHYYFTGNKAAAIAAINDELEDADLRKITRAMVERIRNAARVWFAMTLEEANALEQIASALESYLPPL